MKVTLKDYQEDAAQRSLNNLGKASRRWHAEDERSSFALSAITGAGKTVISAAVIEALFYGSDEFNTEPDPTATVIWFSDSPTLNEQSRTRLMGASQKLEGRNLVRVEAPFSLPKFAPGKVYFLNTHKLSSTSLLVRGYDAGDNSTNPHPGVRLRPDQQGHTIWDTIRNTIQDDKRTLILLLDEAHRGLGRATSDDGERATIVSRLINGHGDVPGIPVVFGISATVERFSKAMSVAANRTRMPDVSVDPKLVQKSGLLKDTTVLQVPGETGKFDTVLVRTAAQKLLESSQAWAEYAKQQTDADVVRPLMVLQVPNKPNANDVATAISTILETYPGMDASQIRHVFGEGKAEVFGPYAVSYMEPDQIQGATHVRVVIAKDAISSGWDAPRAEVLVSFRPANQETYIRQLIGRMVRTPLARRIAGNELLNSVFCYLPFFNAQTVEKVAEELRVGNFGVADDPGSIGHNVVVNGVTLLPNPDVPSDVWKLFGTLPSHTLPAVQSRPMRRLSDLAHNLTLHAIRPGAVAEAQTEFNLMLDGASARFAPDVKEARESVLKVDGVSYKVDMTNQTKSFDQFVADADVAVIDAAYKRARRTLGGDYVQGYVKHLVDGMGEDTDYEDALVEAQTTVAALGLVPDIQSFVMDEAAKLTKKWLDEHRVQISNLTDEKTDIYRKIREQSAGVEIVELSVPRSGIGSPSTNVNGQEVDNPRLAHHLLSDGDGLYPNVSDSSWEEEVLEKELHRPGFVAWYRNPPRPSPDSLAISYQHGGDTKLMRPDFLFFSRMEDGSVAASIVDPHKHNDEDSLSRLIGLASFAANFADRFLRIEALAKVKGQMRLLDLTDAATREAIDEATRQGVTVESLYLGSHSALYV